MTSLIEGIYGIFIFFKIKLSPIICHQFDFLISKWVWHTTIPLFNYFKQNILKRNYRDIYELFNWNNYMNKNATPQDHFKLASESKHFSPKLMLKKKKKVSKCIFNQELFTQSSFNIAYL